MCWLIVCAFELAANEVIRWLTGAGAQNTGDSDRSDGDGAWPFCDITSPSHNNTTGEGGWAPWMSVEDRDTGEASRAEPET